MPLTPSEEKTVKDWLNDTKNAKAKACPCGTSSGFQSPGVVGLHGAHAGLTVVPLVCRDCGLTRFISLAVVTKTQSAGMTDL